MSPFDASDNWQARAARYQRLSTLLGEDKKTAPLHALALEMQEQVERAHELTARSDDLLRYTAVLLAELGAVVACINGKRLRTSRYSAADVREEARLCIEEAQTGVDDAMRRSLLGRAFELAQLGEQIDRGS